MDENEKKLIQAQHRLEEAQARDRVPSRALEKPVFTGFFDAQS